MATKTKAKTKKKPEVTEEELSPLRGVVKLGKQKVIKLRKHLIHETNCLTEDENGKQTAGVLIEVEDEAGVRHEAGHLIFSTHTKKWAYLGDEEPSVVEEGKKLYKRRGEGTYAKALKELLKYKWPDAWNYETDWDRLLGDAS